MPVEFRGLTFERPGHSTLRIDQIDGPTVYIDPWSEVLDGSPKDGDVVLISHDDHDHFDPSGITAVADDDSIAVVHESIPTGDIGIETIQLGVGDCVEVREMMVVGTPAFNLASGPHTGPEGDPYHPKGSGIGFLCNPGGVNVLYPGDTDALDALCDLTAAVVVPPIGGTYTMDPQGASRLVEAIDPELVIPVHYNTPGIEGIDVDARAFGQTVATLGIDVELL